MNRVFPVLILSLGIIVGTSMAVAYAAGTIDLLGNVLVDGTLTIQDGTQGFGKVFTSDGLGQGSWQEAAADIFNLNPVCSADKVQHWNGIEFFLVQPISGDNLPDIRPNVSYQIIVQVNPNDVIDPLALVVEKLNADGYTDQGVPFTVDSIPAGINQVSYSTICAEN